MLSPRMKSVGRGADGLPVVPMGGNGALDSATRPRTFHPCIVVYSTAETCACIDSRWRRAEGVGQVLFKSVAAW